MDAANCYDGIAHAITSLVFHYFGIPEKAIETMLTAIEDMKYFLYTAYGDSKEYVGSTIEARAMARQRSGYSRMGCDKYHNHSCT